MAHLYLTRKWMKNQQPEALLGHSASNRISAPHLRRLGSNRSGSLVTINNMDYDDVEDLEMLLEAYLMQLDRTRKKILSVREYIDDTEDYVNIQLDNQRNELIQLQLTLTIASFAVAVETLISGIFGMNIHCILSYTTRMGYLRPLLGVLRHFPCYSSFSSSGIRGGRSCLVHESSLSSVVDSTGFTNLFTNPKATSL